MKYKPFLDKNLKIILITVITINIISFIVTILGFSLVVLFFEIFLSILSAVLVFGLFYLSVRVGIILHFVKKILPSYYPISSIAEIDKFVIKNLLLFKNELLQISTEKSRFLKYFYNIDKVGIIVVDSSFQILFYNKYVEDFFEITQRYIGKRLVSLFALISTRISLDKVEQELEVIKENDTKTLKIFINDSEDAKVIYFFDITQVKKLQKVSELTMSIISHELNTPLTNITLALENILFSKEVSEEVVNIILSNIYRLNTTISNIMNLSNIYSERVFLSKSRFDIREVIELIVESLYATYKNKKMEVSVNFEGGSIIDEDRDKLQLILVNIIDNAMKFCNEGGSVNISSYISDKGYKIVISNTGSTIQEEEKEKIFEMFYRGRGVIGKGSGLGLYIVKLLSNILSLEVSVYSENNKTSFVLEKIT